jgi:hypothetical protein
MVVEQCREEDGTADPALAGNPPPGYPCSVRGQVDVPA